MSKNLSIRAQGYDVMFCYTRNGRKFAKIRTDHRLKGGFWASLQTMLRMSEEIEAEFYEQLRMPLKSHVRLIAYDQHDDPVVVALMHAAQAARWFGAKLRRRPGKPESDA